MIRKPIFVFPIDQVQFVRCRYFVDRCLHPGTVPKFERCKISTLHWHDSCHLGFGRARDQLGFEGVGSQRPALPMIHEDEKRISELFKLVSQECERPKFLALVTELNQLLELREERTKQYLADNFGKFFDDGLS
jgi:hypothetical protein